MKKTALFFTFLAILLTLSVSAEGITTEIVKANKVFSFTLANSKTEVIKVIYSDNKPVVEARVTKNGNKVTVAPVSSWKQGKTYIITKIVKTDKSFVTSVLKTFRILSDKGYEVIGEDGKVYSFNKGIKIEDSEKLLRVLFDYTEPQQGRAIIQLANLLNATSVDVHTNLDLETLAVTIRKIYPGEKMDCFVEFNFDPRDLTVKCVSGLNEFVNLDYLSSQKQELYNNYICDIIFEDELIVNYLSNMELCTDEFSYYFDNSQEDIDKALLEGKEKILVDYEKTYRVWRIFIDNNGEINYFTSVLTEGFEEK